MNVSQVPINLAISQSDSIFHHIFPLVWSHSDLLRTRDMSSLALFGTFNNLEKLYNSQTSVCQYFVEFGLQSVHATIP